MRALIFFIWLALYIMGMWTESALQFAREMEISFQLRKDVSWEGFWSLSYLGDLRTNYALLVQKVSHYLSSLLLALLFFNWVGLHLSAIYLLFFGVTTVEMLQVYFGREALALDVLLNTAGVLSGAALLWVWQNVLEEKALRTDTGN